MIGAGSVIVCVQTQPGRGISEAYQVIASAYALIDSSEFALPIVHILAVTPHSLPVAFPASPPMQ